MTVPRNPNQLSDALWVDDIGFLAHNRRYDPEFPGKTYTHRKDFEETLTKSGKLPDLGRAPIASWFLARLAQLCGKRFPFSYGQVIGSDGADYWLRLYCLKRPATIVGIVHCSGKQTGTRLSLQHYESQNADPVLDKFIHALLESPAELARCKVIVQYTEFTDPELKVHIPRIYGWNGLRYFNEGAPQHAIDPDEYE
jgi:hypothetical protein